MNQTDTGFWFLDTGFELDPFSIIQDPASGIQHLSAQSK
jgi:hypothetical protein